jgi:outer membrane receptor for ferrienterochelin and colicin
MMRSGYIFLPLFWLSTLCGFPQADTAGSLTGLDLLQAGDLVFSTDSNWMNVISAGRISKNLDELPLTVYVISHEEILRNQFTSLIDVLNALPGITTSKPGYGELGESFQIWGLTGNLYTKILINGLPVKPSVVAGMPIGSQLPVRQAEKIEVVYGTSAAVYGADAVSGVINIITREADKGSFVRGDLSLGEDGYSYVNFFLGGKGGKNNNILQYSFYGSYSDYARMDIGNNDQDIYNPLNYYQERDQTFNIGGTTYEALEIDENLLRRNGINPRDFMDQYYGKYYEGTLTQPAVESLGASSNMLGLHMKFRGIGLSYNKMYRRSHSSLGLSPVFYKYNDPQNYWGENIHRFTLSYVKEFNRFSSSTNLCNLVYRMDNNSNLGVTFLSNTDRVYRYSASDELLFEQVFSGAPVKNLELVAGFSYQQSGNLPVTNYLTTPFNKKLYQPYDKTVASSDTVMGNFGLNPVDFNNLSGFLQFFYQLGGFRFLGGLRYDRNTLYGNKFSPQLGILYKSGGLLTANLSYGRAYKAPPSSLVFQSLAYPTGDGLIHYQVVPNRDLKPEQFNSLELGINRPVFRKRAMLNQTFYYYRITDHIMPRTLPMSDINYPNPANDSVKTWINNGESVSHVLGSQTTLRFTNLVKSVHLDTEVSLSFMNRQDHFPDVVNIAREYLTLMPRHSGKLKVSLYPVKNLYIYVESLWQTSWLRVLIPFEKLYQELFKDADGYYSLNAMTSYNLSENLSVYLKVTNLFDEKYGSVNATILEENLVYNPQLRRSIRFGLSYRLN